MFTIVVLHRGWLRVLPILLLTTLYASAAVSAGASYPSAHLSSIIPSQAHDHSSFVPISNSGPCTPGWSVTSSPNVSTYNNLLGGVAAISASDVWAVGSHNNLGGASQTLTEHWNGSAWNVIPSPNVGTDNNSLSAAAAVSSNDVWAVGQYSNGTVPRTLIQHWNGSAWSIVPSPNLGATPNVLNSIAAISANDVWAVGYGGGGSGTANVTIALHWDGSAWSLVPTPNNDTVANTLDGVSAISANDVWAVGDYYNTTLGAHQTLVEHWNGSAWSIVPTPNVNPGHDFLYAISALSANDVWAAGYTLSSNSRSQTTLVEHWNGNAWSIVPTPNVDAARNTLTGVAAVAPNDVWAVGYAVPNSLVDQTLTLHWDGSAWSFVSSPNVGTSYNDFYGVGGIPSSGSGANAVWAVGRYYNPDDNRQTLVESYSAPCTTPMLVGHVNWEARPPQPDPLDSLPVTLTLKLGTTEIDYPIQSTDQYGFFTVTLGSLPNGTYLWRVDDASSTQHSPNYLANSGTVNLMGAPITNLDMGLMLAGDANHDNLITLPDFNLLKLSFGSGCGDPQYDNRPDFTGDCRVNIADFNPLKANFGHNGAPPITPYKQKHE